jgi:predicted metal-dependent hydrolase
MRPNPPPNYLAGYPAHLVDSVRHAIAQGKLAGSLLRKYPQAHDIRTDRALYDYVQDIRNRHLKNTAVVSKVAYDSKLQTLQKALGTHTTIGRVQGGKIKAKREIRVAGLFRDMPGEFLRMIVVHELAHLKESDHNKAFYQLCQHMEPDYFQLEFDLRSYLSYLDAGGEILWATPSGAEQGIAG